MTTQTPEQELHNAVLTVANTVSNNRESLQYFIDEAQHWAAKPEAKEATKDLREILDALNAWTRASNTFIESIGR